MHSPRLEQGGSPGLGPHTPLSSPSVSGTLVLALRVEVMMGGLWSQPRELLAVTGGSPAVVSARGAAGSHSHRAQLPGCPHACRKRLQARSDLWVPEDRQGQARAGHS